jgi:hypothetical protein
LRSRSRFLFRVLHVPQQERCDKDCYDRINRRHLTLASRYEVEVIKPRRSLSRDRISRYP